MPGYLALAAIGMASAEAAAGIAQEPAEWLAPADRAALQVSENERTERRVKTVYLGRGETATNWTRRLTLWSYRWPGLDRAGFTGWATRIRQDIITDCPGVRAGAMRLFDWSGRAAAEFLIVCPLFPGTGRPDIYLVRSIAGDRGVLSAAVTFRQAPTDAQTAAARSYLDTLLLCTPASARLACH